MSLMYEALRPKSSAEYRPGFSALHYQMASVRYIEKSDSILGNSILRRKIIAWVLSAGVLALLIAVCILIVTRENKVSDISKNDSVNHAKNLAQSVPSVENTSAREQKIQPNTPIAVSLNPPPQYNADVLQVNKASVVDKKATSLTSVLSKKIIEEKSGREKSPIEIQKPSNDVAKTAQVSKSGDLILSPESNLKVPDKEPAVTIPVQPIAQPSDTLNLADHFDAMNRELSRGSKSQAGTHLKAIQAALAPSSISRLRAEGWYEYHAGNLEASKAIYRKILNRIPGDENATSVLQVIEIKSGGSSTSK